MNIDRTKAIELAEQAYREEQDFRAWMTARLGTVAGTVAAEAILSTPEPSGLSNEHLHASIYFHLGLPPDTTLSEQQRLWALGVRGDGVEALQEALEALVSPPPPR